MNHALVIAGREVAEKRFVFVAAAAFALIAAVMPLMPGLHGNGAEAVVVAAMVLAPGLALGLAAILGANIVSRDIVTGRMPFYFARPVGGAAIWFGKLAAALVLVAGSFVIAIAPALVAAPLSTRRLWGDSVWQVVAVVGAAALVLFFGGHTLWTMIRSRSVLIAADFAAAAAMGMVAWLLVRPLLLVQAIGVLEVLRDGLAAALLLAAIGAGTWQLVDGRTDVRRSHRSYSTFLWSALGLALLLAAGFVGWIVSATPSDLTSRTYALQAPRGDAALLTGDARHRFDYRPTFVAGTRANGTVWGAFSRDGQRGAFLESTISIPRSMQLVLRDAAHGWRATPTNIAFHNWVGAIVATDDLSRVAVVDGNLVSVYDVATSRGLGSFRLNDTVARAMFFVTPDLVRIYANGHGSIDVLEYDVAAHAKTTTARGVAPGGIRVSADGTRALLYRRGAPTMLCDARTLQPIAPAAPGARFLHDGRVVVLPERHRYVGEVAPGKVIVTTPASTRLYDVDRAQFVASRDDLQPLLPPFWSADPRPAMLNPNGLYKKADATIVRWNPLG